MITKDDVVRDLVAGHEHPVVLIVQDATETLGGFIKGIVPFIQAGFSHVVADTYHITLIANAEVIITTEEVHVVCNTTAPGELVELSNQTVCVYRLDPSDLED